MQGVGWRWLSRWLDRHSPSFARQLFTAISHALNKSARKYIPCSYVFLYSFLTFLTTLFFLTFTSTSHICVFWPPIWSRPLIFHFSHCLGIHQPSHYLNPYCGAAATTNNQRSGLTTNHCTAQAIHPTTNSKSTSLFVPVLRRHCRVIGFFSPVPHYVSSAAIRSCCNRRLKCKYLIRWK